MRNFTERCCCGSADCPRCSPDCNRLVECKRCGAVMRQWLSASIDGGTYCDECAEAVEMERLYKGKEGAE